MFDVGLKDQEACVHFEVRVLGISPSLLDSTSSPEQRLISSRNTGMGAHDDKKAP